MWTEKSFLLGQLIKSRRAGILHAVDWMTKARHPVARGQPDLHGAASNLAQGFVVVLSARLIGQGVGEELCGISGGAQKHTARSEQSRRYGPLDRLGGTGVGQACGQCTRGESMVGKRDQYRIQKSKFSRCGLAISE